MWMKTTWMRAVKLRGCARGIKAGDVEPLRTHKVSITSLGSRVVNKTFCLSWKQPVNKGIKNKGRFQWLLLVPVESQGSSRRRHETTSLLKRLASLGWEGQNFPSPLCLTFSFFHLRLFLSPSYVQERLMLSLSLSVICYSPAASTSFFPTERQSVLCSQTHVSVSLCCLWEKPRPLVTLPAAWSHFIQSV